MADRRHMLIAVFRDTENFWAEDPLLAEAIRQSVRSTTFYDERDYPPLPEPHTEAAHVVLSGKTSFQAARDRYFASGGEHIAVLNFASAVNPGGGVRGGASAQEESLCRCSTLFPTLAQPAMMEKYYDVNRRKDDPLHSDACIWSPGIVICKDDFTFDRLPPEERAVVDVITCAAPDLRWGFGDENDRTISTMQQYEIHLKRARHILHLAASRSTDALILGAFGCGAFMNEPKAVAAAYRNALAEYIRYFKYVEFAVYCRSDDKRNYAAFQKAIGGQG